MNGYLVPANAKRGTLILNLFRPFDIILFGAGILITLLLFVIIPTGETIAMILACLPVGITGFLVIPIPNYHNVLCAIQSIIKFYSERRNYIWKGWCFYEKFAVDEEQKK